MPIIANNGPYFQKSGKNVVFSFRIDEEVYDAIKAIAAAEKRSINKQLEIFVETAVIEYLEKNDNATLGQSE